MRPRKQRLERTEGTRRLEDSPLPAVVVVAVAEQAERRERMVEPAAECPQTREPMELEVLVETEEQAHLQTALVIGQAVVVARAALVETQARQHLETVAQVYRGTMELHFLWVAEEVVVFRLQQELLELLDPVVAQVESTQLSQKAERRIQVVAVVAEEIPLQVAEEMAAQAVPVSSPLASRTGLWASSGWPVGAAGVPHRPSRLSRADRGAGRPAT